MPGGSKKGGGLTVKKSALYKKQGYGEAISPFMMKGWSPFTQKEGFIERTKREFKPLLKEGMKESEEIFSRSNNPKLIQKAYVKSHGYERGLYKLAKHKVKKVIKRLKSK